jgi:ABC-type transport system substrate-binding protein
MFDIKFRRSALIPLALLLSLAALAATACGGESAAAPATAPTAETIVQTVIVEKDGPVVVVTSVSETTKIVEVTVAPASRKTLNGTVVVATNTVGVPVGTPELCVPGCGNEKYLMGAWDTLFRASPDGTLNPNLAESWKLASDNSSITFKMRSDVEFHKGWGLLTAEDVVWTLNSINGATNPDSIHDNVGDFAANYGLAAAVDDVTVEVEITNFDSRTPRYLFSEFWQGMAISSKAVFDEFGKEGMRDKFIGTGPFVLDEWVDDSHISLIGVSDHWYKTPGVATARILEVPEEATRIAMFETGQADITRVNLPNLPKLLLIGGKVRPVVGSQKTFSFGGGNYLEKTRASNGDPLDSPGFNPDLPWVGDPNAAGCDYDDMLLNSLPLKPVCESMENARLVRAALTMSIDREGIAEAIYGGLATPSFMTHLSTEHPLMKDEWVIPYDVEKAKELLIQAGYPDGFDMEMYAGVGASALELATAVSAAWQSELGINLTFDQQAYSAIRPSFVDRSFQKTIVGGWTTAWPPDWPQGREDNSWFFGGTQKYGNLPFSALTYGKMLSEADTVKREETAVAWYEHENFWHWQPGVVDVPTFDVYNADRIDWDPQRATSIWWGGVATAMPLEDVQVK